MPYSSPERILRGMLSETSSDGMRSILREIGDYSDVGLDERFGPFDFVWHSFGDNPSNLSTIGLATRAGRSLTERLTNAMDAILEDRLRRELYVEFSFDEDAIPYVTDVGGERGTDPEKIRDDGKGP